MRVLAIDTATTALVTGVVDTATGQTTERVLEDTRAHNELLIPTITEVLAEAEMEYSDLDAVVTGVGPGPFTGLRVGMATASALADALSITMSNPTAQTGEKAGVHSGGYGIVGMRERASVVGGSLQVQDGEESFSWTLRLPRKEEK